MSQELSLEALIRQEEELVLPSFDAEAAFNLGMLIVERAKKDGVVIAVSVSIARQIVFQYAFIGNGPDADNWIRRKSNVVYDHQRSSLAVYTKWAAANSTVERYGRTSADYAVLGGSFPIRVKGAGFVGAVTITGLDHLVDHAYAVDALKEYLAKHC